MVEQHIEEVAEFGRDAAVLQGAKIGAGSHVGMTKQAQVYGSHARRVWERESDESASISLIVFS